MIHEMYQNMSNRNARAKELKAQGYRVAKGRSVGSRLHPQYVKDYNGSFETGFGNTDYMTTWGTLYNLAAKKD